MPEPDPAILPAIPRADCSICRAVDVVGDRWLLLVLREAFRGVRRFDAFQDALGASRSVLAARLARAVEIGVLRRVPYAEPGQRPRHEYRLTRKGVELLPALLALMEWGDRHLRDADPPVQITAGDAREPVRMALVTASGREVTDIRELRAEWTEQGSSGAE